MPGHRATGLIRPSTADTNHVLPMAAIGLRAAIAADLAANVGRWWFADVDDTSSINKDVLIPKLLSVPKPVPISVRLELSELTHVELVAISQG